MALKKRDIRVMVWNAKDTVLIGINKTKCAKVIHNYDADIVLMQNIQSDGLNATINDRYVSDLRDKKLGLAIYRKRGFGGQPDFSYKVHTFNKKQGYQLFTEDGFLFINAFLEAGQSVSALTTKSSQLTHVWQTIKQRVRDKQAERGVILCGSLGLDPAQPLDYDKLYSYNAIGEFKIASYNSTGDYLMYKGPKLTPSETFIHTAEAGPTGGVGHRIPLSAVITYDPD